MRGRSLAIVGGLLASLALSAPASAQFTPGARSAGDRLLPLLGNGGYDVQHYDVTLKYDPAANTMLAGSQTDITMRATQGLSQFSLDLKNTAYTISEVTIDGVAATIAREGDKLVVTPAAGIANNRVFHTVVKHPGAPLPIEDPDGSFEGWYRLTTGGIGTGAFVVNEPMGTNGWLPANNYPSDKATYDYHITVPTTHKAVGNGELASRVDNGDGTWTWNWHMGYPMASYLTTATVGLFNYVETQSPQLSGTNVGATALGVTGQPLKIYDFHETALNATQLTTAATAAGRQDDIVKFISDKISAPYPFESHGTVLHRNNLGYALEVQTKSHFSGTSISLSTLAHEVAHQWFGDSVGPATWDEIWFNEGFGRFWQYYWDNQQNGNPLTTAARFNADFNSTTQPDSRWATPPAHLPGPADLFDTFPVYQRPFLMLEAYRQIVGDTAFFAFQDALVTEYAYSDITIDEFIALAKRVAQEKAGFDSSNTTKLNTFFEQWLLGTTKPTLSPATFFLSTSNTGDVSGTVPATLSLALGTPASFGPFVPGVARDYDASTTGTVISTAGDALLSISDPSTNARGRLVNGAFALAQPLKVKASSANGTGTALAPLGDGPLSLLSYTGPTSNDVATIEFQQSIAANEPLRTGTYAKTLTFTLSTTTP